MTSILYVALGSALGGVCRYLVSLALNAPKGFPWGTFAVNVAGALAIGLLSGWLAKGDHAAAIRLFAVVGFCGGFTTFSTYNMELLTFVRTGDLFPALAYFSFNVIGGFVCCWLGFATGNALWG